MSVLTCLAAETGVIASGFVPAKSAGYRSPGFPRDGQEVYVRIEEMSTPALLLDSKKMETNIRTLHHRLTELHVPLRPHVKTAKSGPPVKGMTEGQPGGICVSTLREALFFFELGYRDIVYAVGITPDKLDQVADLQNRGVDLKIVLDHPLTAGAVATHGQGSGNHFKVLIEIDCDGERAGIAPHDDVLLEIAQILHQSPHTELAGVLTHAGASYHCRGPQALIAMAEQERLAVVTAAERLKAAGFACPIVSLGSTPTAFFARNLDGVTEVRAGVFVFFDLYQAGLGTCRLEDIALSVVATVISHQPHKQRLILDAGALALSKDHGTAALPLDRGFGLLCGLSGVPLDPELHITELNQEHGMVHVPRHFDFALLPLGSKVRILPSHACLTAAAYDAYNVTADGATVYAQWSRCNGW